MPVGNGLVDGQGVVGKGDWRVVSDRGVGKIGCCCGWQLKIEAQKSTG